MKKKLKTVEVYEEIIYEWQCPMKSCEARNQSGPEEDGKEVECCGCGRLFEAKIV